MSKLIRSGARLDIPDRNGNTPLHVACQAGRVSCIRALFSERCANMPNADGQLPIHLATGNKTALTTLIKRGADPNARNEYGKTPLHMTLGSYPIFKHLVESGARLDVQDHDGNTAFHVACWMGRLRWVRLLLSVRPSLANSPNGAGRRPVHITTHEATLRVLKKAGARYKTPRKTANPTRVVSRPTKRKQPDTPPLLT
jgi:ankyrin repeat protein